MREQTERKDDEQEVEFDNNDLMLSINYQMNIFKELSQP